MLPGTGVIINKFNIYIASNLILEVVLEREPGSGSFQFSAYGFIAPTRRLTCDAPMTCDHVCPRKG